MAMGWKQYTVSKDPTKLPCLLGTLFVSVHCALRRTTVFPFAFATSCSASGSCTLQHALLHTCLACLILYMVSQQLGQQAHVGLPGPMENVVHPCLQGHPASWMRHANSAHPLLAFSSCQKVS